MPEMTLEFLVQAATVASLLLAAAALAHGAWVYKRQMNAQLFLEYTGRYDDVMQSLRKIPEAAARIDVFANPPPESAPLTLAVLSYLNLCSEEYYLMQRSYLARDVWSIWEGEMERTLRSPLARREWETLRGEFTAYEAFQRYVDRLQPRGGAGSPGREATSEASAIDA